MDHKEIFPLPCMVGWGRCTTVGLESCARLALVAQSGAPNFYYKANCLRWQGVMAKTCFWVSKELLGAEEGIVLRGNFSMHILGLLCRTSKTDGQALAEYAIAACILAVIFVKCMGIFEQALFRYFARITQCFMVARFL